MVKQNLKNFFPLLIGILLVLSGCNGNSNSSTENKEDIINHLVSYKDSDYYTNWQADQFTYINLEGSTATVDGTDGAVVEDNQILIRTSGTYVVNGTLEDGQLVIDAEDTGNVRLVLNGATIHSSTSSPIFVKQADKTIISLEENTENTLSDTINYVYADDATDEPSATIYSKDDLTINGSGTLTVQGNYHDAIKSNDDLKITGGTINITSIDDGIVGKDLLAIKDATITVTAGGDGLKASNDEDNSKGNIALESGNYTVEAEGDGIQAENVVAVSDGEYVITTGGGSPETIETREDNMGGNMRGEGPDNLNQHASGSMVDHFWEGVDIPEELQEKLENAKDMEEIQTILQDYPDVLNQIQENDNMRGFGVEEGNGALPNGPTNIDGQPPQQPDTSTGQPPQHETPDEQPAIKENHSSENDETETTEQESTSTKGIKAGTALYISGGTWKIDSLDDAIHSNQDVSISGGDITISTGDDGIHGDQDVMLAGGNVSIKKSYEGIEGTNITVTDGYYHIVAEDDGVNVNGGSEEFEIPGELGNMSPEPNNTAALEERQDAETTRDSNNSSSEDEKEVTDDGLLAIKGGYLLVDANGDGLDSNGSVEMTDGIVIVYGPTNNGNGPLDYDDSFVMEGGILVASGSSGMAQGISEASSQQAIMMNYSEFQEANTAVYITDENGEKVMAIAPEKQFQSILVSTPNLKLNQTYSFHSGGVLTGDHENGMYQNASYEGNTFSVEFPLSTVMTYLNEDGVTEGNSTGMMNERPFGRERMERNNPFEKEQDSEHTFNNME